MAGLTGISQEGESSVAEGKPTSPDRESPAQKARSKQIEDSAVQHDEGGDKPAPTSIEMPLRIAHPQNAERPTMDSCSSAPNGESPVQTGSSLPPFLPSDPNPDPSKRTELPGLQDHLASLYFTQDKKYDHPSNTQEQSLRNSPPLQPSDPRHATCSLPPFSQVSSAPIGLLTYSS